MAAGELTEAPPRRLRGSTIAVVLLTLATAGLCLHDLGSRSIWLDEGASYSIATQHGSALWHALPRDGGNLIAYYLLLHVVTSIFGSGEVVLRLPSVLFAAATVPLTFAFGRRLCGERAGLYAAALVGISLSLVYWGQMARGYTFGSVLAAASGLYFVRARESTQRRYSVLWALSVLLLCWTLLLGVALVLAELVTLVVPGAVAGARRRLAGATAVVALCCVPLALLALHRGGGQLFWLKRPDLAAVRSVVSYLAGGYYQVHESRLSDALVVLFCACVVICAVYALVGAIKNNKAVVFASVLLLSSAVLVPVGVYVASRIGDPIFIDRYFSFCLPAASLIVAIPLSLLRPRLLGIGALVVVLVVRVDQLGPLYGLNVDDWQGATAGIESLAHPGDCIAFYANDGFVDFSYYLSHPPPGAPSFPALVSVLPKRSFGTDPVIIEQYATFSARELAALPDRCPALFLVQSHDGAANGSPQGQVVHRHFLQMQRQVAGEYAAVIVRRYLGVSCFLYSAPRRVATASAPTPAVAG